MSSQAWPEVTIYTDGSCNPNPGPGGWASVLLFPDRPPRELSGSEARTTNNRMELQAALAALRSVSTPHRVCLCTDSEYVRKGVVEWLARWAEQDWQTSARAAVKNRDLWQALAEQVARHEVTWQWVKGHAGDRWNEHVDKLARSMIPSLPLPLDDEQAVHIFAAASYLGQVKKGGWAVLLRYRDRVKTMSGGEAETSSNRLHIRSAVAGLGALKQSWPVHLYTTSDYLKNGATVWTKNWVQRGWQTKGGEPVKHRELWETLAGLTRRYAVTWHVVGKGDLPGELKQAKKLASEAARSP
jgi:ribonuclease HI